MFCASKTLFKLLTILAIFTNSCLILISSMSLEDTDKLNLSPAKPNT